MNRKLSMYERTQLPCEVPAPGGLFWSFRNWIASGDAHQFESPFSTHARKHQNTGGDQRRPADASVTVEPDVFSHRQKIIQLSHKLKGFIQRIGHAKILNRKTNELESVASAKFSLGR